MLLFVDHSFFSILHNNSIPNRRARRGSAGGTTATITIANTRNYLLTTTVMMMMLVLLLLPSVQASSSSSSGATTTAAATTTTAVHRFWWHEHSRAPKIHGLLRSIPAFTKSSSNSNNSNGESQPPTLLASVRTRLRKPDLSLDPNFFMGITPQTTRAVLEQSEGGSSSRQREEQQPKRVNNLRQGMTEALQELRTMRHEMEELRREVASLKQLQQRTTGQEETTALAQREEEEEASSEHRTLAAKRRQQRELEQLGRQVEEWAEDLLFRADEDEDGDSTWTEVMCNKLLKSKFNKDDRTRAYLKWMPDSRGPSKAVLAAKHQQPENGKEDDSKGKKRGGKEQEPALWPCIRMYSTIEAPCEEVCRYLAQEERIPEYNQLIEEHEDLEDITPHSKVVWGQTPQILFVKPRDFITFCHYRFRPDGTQVVVNQAFDEYNGQTANAFALRGATFISPDPHDPERTQIAMLAHASPGNDLPVWACKTAIKSLAPIEPYRLFHKINQGVQRSRAELQTAGQKDTEMVGSGNTIRQQQLRKSPAGLSQLGYACFWPHGEESSSSGASSMDGAESQEGEQPSSTTSSSFVSSSAVSEAATASENHDVYNSTD